MIHVTVLFQLFNAIIMPYNNKDRHPMVTFPLKVKAKKKATIEDLIGAFKSAKEVAYKAVMKPVEGTILTVIRESSEALCALKKVPNSVEDLMDILLEESKKSLDHTPELLPVLKDVGVVDSGDGLRAMGE